jgi:hypothetical protein
VPDPTEITVVDEQVDRASVEVVSPAGRSRIDVVKHGGRWRVDLPQYGSP